MSKAIALGEKHLIVGFKGAGFEIVPIEESSKLMPALIALTRDPEIGIVFVTESMAEESPQAIMEFRQRSSAMLTVIPTHEGSRHTSFHEIRKSVEKAIGVDILGEDKTISNKDTLYE
jgi:V/A-type H+-transporting ATPase subunit F